MIIRFLTFKFVMGLKAALAPEGLATATRTGELVFTASDSMIGV